MLSPAEELGISDLGLDSRLRRIFSQLPSKTLVELSGRLTREALTRKLIYLREGREEPIIVFARPIGVMPDQLAYVHTVSLALLNALKRIPDLYLSDPAVRALLPLSEREEGWLRDSWGPRHRENNSVFGRLDATIDFASPGWKDSLRFLEPNLAGVGGIHFSPVCDAILMDVVVPLLTARDPGLSLTRCQDLRDLLMQKALDHLEATGRKKGTLCFLEPVHAGSGPDEQAEIARYFRERHGMTVLHADPEELTLMGGEVYHKDQQVDIAYRDYEVRDLLALEDKFGRRLDGVRALFRENRIISSVGGDFDHKSCWELLTEPGFAQRYFTPEERSVFRHHLLWTRVLSDRRTSLPDPRVHDARKAPQDGHGDERPLLQPQGLGEGEVGDLLPYVRDNRELLVLKPNRSYGGDRIVLGSAVTQQAWETAVNEALQGESWVVQSAVEVPVNELPVVTDKGQVHFEPFYTVMGFAPTEYGVGIVCRASQKQVVNVAQHGGLCGVLLGGVRPPLEAALQGAPVGS